MPIRPFALRGRRDAVSVLCTWSRPADASAIKVEVIEERMDEPETHRVEAVVPSEPPRAARMADRAAIAPRPGQRQKLPDPDNMTARRIASHARPHIPSRRTATEGPAIEPERRQPRTTRSPDLVRSMLSVALQQIAGTSDREPPDLEGNRPPDYPPAAIEQGLEGTVLLRLTIDVRGAVTEVEVIESSGHQLLDEAAVEAVKSWRGRPARRGGRPVPIRQLLPVRFRL